MKNSGVAWRIHLDFTMVFARCVFALKVFRILPSYAHSLSPTSPQYP